METEFVCRDGTRVPVLLGAATLDSGRETVAFLLDISEQKRLENDLAEASARQQRIAETLQRSLLLSPAEDAFPGLRIATYYEAASDEAKVGGDFFDAFLLEDGRVALVVGDVMGKGLTAATRTAEVRFGLRAFLRDGSSPTAADSLARLNRFLFSSNVRDAAVIVAGEDEAAVLPRGFICLSLALVDPRTGEAEVAAAGAELPLVLRARTGSVEPALDPQDPRERGLCPLLGVDPDAIYSTAALRLEPDDALLMLTDGLPEARRPGTVEFFGSSHLAREYAKAAARPPADAVRFLAEGARRFAGGALRDVVCLLLAVCTPLERDLTEVAAVDNMLSSP
jgi:serine phosphatase RsbU (regulator of sigma subunit)